MMQLIKYLSIVDRICVSITDAVEIDDVDFYGGDQLHYLLAYSFC